jgi:hypothetical protein
LSPRNARSAAVTLLGTLGTVVLIVASTTSGLGSALRTVISDAALLANGEALIIGGSGTPIPGDEYIDNVFDRYIVPNFGEDFDPKGLFTPEGLYPFTGVKNLPLDTSVDQGVTILHQSLTDPDGTASGVDADNVAVLGYSQSAVIASLEMEKLADMGDEAPDKDDLSFALIGDPMNPNGGLLERFEDLTLPSLGINFYGATPSDTAYDTDIYSLEYDGFADFPTYPINLLSDLNALAGIALVHGSYPTLSDEQLSEDNVTELETSAGYDGATDYYMIHTDTLPLLAPLQSVPVIGQPIYDLLEPDVRILVNLGYGDVEHGWDQGPADEATPFGLFPSDVDFGEVLQALGDGAEKGFQNFADDLGSLDLGSLSDSSDSMTDGSDDASDSSASLTDIVNAFTGALSSAYATLLPTADIANALLTTLPAYEATLFSDGLDDGDLLAALGDPLAANTGLTTMALGFEAISIFNAVSDIGDEFSGLF